MNEEKILKIERDKLPKPPKTQTHAYKLENVERKTIKKKHRQKTQREVIMYESNKREAVI